jgi:hypothetical protein
MCTLATSIDMLFSRSASIHARDGPVLDPPGGAAEQPCCLRLGAERDSLHSSISGTVVAGLAVLIAVDGKPQEKKSKNWAPKGSPRKWGAMSVVCWE